MKNKLLIICLLAFFINACGPSSFVDPKLEVPVRTVEAVLEAYSIPLLTDTKYLIGNKCENKNALACAKKYKYIGQTYYKVYVTKEAYQKYKNTHSLTVIMLHEIAHTYGLGHTHFGDNGTFVEKYIDYKEFLKWTIDDFLNDSRLHELMGTIRGKYE